MSEQRLWAIDAAKRHNKNAGARGLVALVQGETLYFCPCTAGGEPKMLLGYQLCQGAPTPPDPDPAFGASLELWQWSDWDDAQYSQRQVAHP